MRVSIAVRGCLIVLGVALLIVWLGSVKHSDSAGARRFQVQPGAAPESAPALTLVTRYPFYFNGSNPRRLLAHERDTSERR